MKIFRFIPLLTFILLTSPTVGATATDNTLAESKIYQDYPTLHEEFNAYWDIFQNIKNVESNSGNHLALLVLLSEAEQKLRDSGIDDELLQSIRDLANHVSDEIETVQGAAIQQDQFEYLLKHFKELSPDELVDTLKKIMWLQPTFRQKWEALNQLALSTEIPASGRDLFLKIGISLFLISDSYRTTIPMEYRTQLQDLCIHSIETYFYHSFESAKEKLFLENIAILERVFFLAEFPQEKIALEELWKISKKMKSEKALNRIGSFNHGFLHPLVLLINIINLVNITTIITVLMEHPEKHLLHLPSGSYWITAFTLIPSITLTWYRYAQARKGTHDPQVRAARRMMTKYFKNIRQSCEQVLEGAGGAS